MKIIQGIVGTIGVLLYMARAEVERLWSTDEQPDNRSGMNLDGAVVRQPHTRRMHLRPSTKPHERVH